MHLSSVALPSASTADAIDWKQVLAPHASQLFPAGTKATDYRITDVRHDASTGASYVYLQQTLDGLDIVNAYANLTILDTGEVLGANSSFVMPELAKTSQSKIME